MSPDEVQRGFTGEKSIAHFQISFFHKFFCLGILLSTSEAWWSLKSQKSRSWINVQLCSFDRNAINFNSLSLIRNLFLRTGDFGVYSILGILDQGSRNETQETVFDVKISFMMTCFKFWSHQYKIYLSCRSESSFNCLSQSSFLSQLSPQRGILTLSQLYNHHTQLIF